MSNDPTPLASLSLTHVYYDPNDPISYLCAFLALVPQALCVVYVTLIWSTREAEVCLAFAGQLACEAVNFALKRIIKEERPHHHRHGSLWGALLGGAYEESNDNNGGAGEAVAAGAAAATGVPNGGLAAHHQPVHHGYGMPSSHAQFAGYWALTIALFLLVRYEAQKKTGKSAARTAKNGNGKAASTAQIWHQRTALSRIERVGASVLAFVVAFLIAWSRVYLHYHTPRQVLAGFAAGLAVGAGWFVATALVRQWGLLDWALGLPPAQWLRLRDLALEEDVLQPGWERWQARQAARDVAKNK